MSDLIKREDAIAKTFCTSINGVPRMVVLLDDIKALPSIDSKTKVVARVTFDEDKLRENRYLDAEWLKGRVHDVALANGALHGCIDKLDIHEAPSIDICFCRECEHFWKYSNLPTKCVFHLSLVNADDFCSYGVKKGADNEAD